VTLLASRVCLLASRGPTSDDAALDADAQKCANLEAWWDFSSPQNPHMPPTTTKCYHPAGASTAGQSNIAWGSNNPPTPSISGRRTTAT
jgi:hypothetical protein